MIGINGELTQQAQYQIEQWRATTCQHCLLSITDTVIQFRLKGVLLKKLLDRLKWAAGLGIESLGASSTHCLQTLLSSLTSELDEAEEMTLADCAGELRAISESSPTVLLELVQAITNALLDEQKTRFDSFESEPEVTQSSTLQQENNGLSKLNLKTVLALIHTILECSQTSISAQNVTNSHPEVILKLETTAVMQALRCLYKLYSSNPSEPKVQSALLDAEALAMRRVSREPNKWKNIVRFILETILNLEQEEFRKRSSRLHTSFTKLVSHPQPTEVTSPVRNLLASYFEKVGELAGLA